MEKQRARGQRAAAARAVATGAANSTSPVPGPLKLQREDSDGTLANIARSLRKQQPNLGDDPSDQAGASFLAASFVAYAAEEKPQTQDQWCGVLSKVLEDAGISLDEDDTDDATRLVIADLSSKGVLASPAPEIEAGAMVLGLLEEDSEWHEAIVQEASGQDAFRIVFLQYGKPQITLATNIRLKDDVVDDEGTEELHKEGNCELCGRRMLLTFHHLIPKDTHPTYMGKPSQLASVGIEGEPTRGFLNTYGTMVCSQCHSNIHSLASNVILAKEYNTLAKILEHPKIQRWVEWAGKQRPDKNRGI